MSWVDFKKKLTVRESIRMIFSVIYGAGVFLIAGLILQIAAIKLVGGFLNTNIKEISEVSRILQTRLNSGFLNSDNFFISDLIDGGAARADILNLALSCCFVCFIFCIDILSAGKLFLARGAARVRPPTFLKRFYFFERFLF